MKSCPSTVWYKNTKSLVAGVLVGAILMGLLWYLSANAELNLFKNLRGMKTIESSQIIETGDVVQPSGIIETGD